MRSFVDIVLCLIAAAAADQKRPAQQGAPLHLGKPGPRTSRINSGVPSRDLHLDPELSSNNDAHHLQGTDPRVRPHRLPVSVETLARVNSRLIYVYDTESCRGVEGMGRPGPSLYSQHHRQVMLQELERRIEKHLAFDESGSGGIDGNIVWGQESLPMFGKGQYGRSRFRSKVDSIYLEALDMEIASVPDSIDVTAMLRISEDLPCVKHVERDAIRYLESSQNSLALPRLHFRLPPNAFSKDLRVEQTEPATATPSFPSDPLFADQWALQGEFGIHPRDAWRARGQWNTTESFPVAIIDSGCDLLHPDLRDQLWRNPGETNCTDGIDNDGNGFIDDCWGWDFVENDNWPQAKGTSHGTAAAGIVAAGSNNEEGIAGICWNCKLMCLRFISGSEGTVADEVRALDYAVRMGARISNNSYGGYGAEGAALERVAIERAHRNGHIFVTSAGNNNLNTDLPDNYHTPSGYNLPNVISVGASSETGAKAGFSNFGKESVDVFAPGRNILSTGAQGYYLQHGTSFAAPHVAGVLALVWSRYPELSRDEVISIAHTACFATTELRNLAGCGGVINTSKALKIAKSMMDGTLSTRASKPVTKTAASSQRQRTPRVPGPSTDSWLSNVANVWSVGQELLPAADTLLSRIIFPLQATPLY